MKKVIKCLVILILIISISIFIYVQYQNSLYPLYKVSSMLNSVKLPSNMHIKATSCYENGAKSILEVNVKDSITNVYQKSENLGSEIQNMEYLTIWDNGNHYTIDISQKKITALKSESYFDFFYGASDFFYNVQNHGKYENQSIYEYCGKELVNNKNCIKISFTSYEEKKICSKDIFYIDLDTNLIIKMESYKESAEQVLKLEKTETYEYDFNSVTEIKTFDINDYPDYEYIGSI